MADASAKGRRLGRGLSSLLGDAVRVAVGESALAMGASAAPVTEGVTDTATAPPPALTPSAGEAVVGGRRMMMVKVLDVTPSRFQPRKAFDEESLGRLADSIRSAGLMQPVLVRRNNVASTTFDAGAPEARVIPAGQGWELVAGERRWRAASRLGLAEIPAVVVELSDLEAAEWGLVENVQREDLSPMDKAEAFERLAKEFDLTHSQIAERVGMERASVTNHLRLMELEPEVRELLQRGALSFGAARALLAAVPGASRVALAKRAAATGMAVRAIEEAAAISAVSGGVRTMAKAEGGEVEAPRADSAVRDMERQLSEQWGTKVKIRAGKKGKKGKIVVEFYSLEHFDGLMEKMGVRLEG